MNLFFTCIGFLKPESSGNASSYLTCIAFDQSFWSLFLCQNHSWAVPSVTKLGHLAKVWAHRRVSLMVDVTSVLIGTYSGLSCVDKTLGFSRLTWWRLTDPRENCIFNFWTQTRPWAAQLSAVSEFREQERIAREETCECVWDEMRINASLSIGK